MKYIKLYSTQSASGNSNNNKDKQKDKSIAQLINNHLRVTESKR